MSNRNVTVFEFGNFVLSISRIPSDSDSDSESDSESEYDVPFTDEEINSIETVSVSRADVEEDKSCCICLLDYNVGEDLRKVPCGGEHLFHEDCLFAWLQTKKTCPMCREELKLDNIIYATDIDFID